MIQNSSRFGIALHSLTGEICGTWVHPLSRWCLGPAVDPVADAAIQAEMCTSCFDAASLVNWRRGNSVAAGKRMAERLARFAMRVSRGPGSCSAVKLKCISPIPISTTPEATIVQKIRDRIRFSSAAVYRPWCAELFSATERPNQRMPENISCSKKWAGPTAGSDRLVRIDSLRAIVHNHGLGKPESAISVAGLRGVWNTHFHNARVATKIA
jgi:hypothetical protein